ncbi:kinesin-like protein KIF9 [Leuresthes tenuis]|uniref:kinesin-like protein KIF9 n=1 Tax=Leuresthes tenuis TaxID=355514 RepID=UPI003B50C09F
MKGHGRVGVFVRIRPTANFAQDLFEIPPDGQTINIHQRKDPKKLLESRKARLNSWSFQLEGVLHNVSQDGVYTRVCKQVVLGALNGYNGTVMCFGQTGAGKTYTMTGSTEFYKQRGIIPRALQEVFEEVGKRTEHAFLVHLSYVEIYNETLMDLLSSLQGPPRLCPQGMAVMEEPGGGVFIRGLSLHPVHSEEEALNLLFEGEMNRIIGSHALNRKSSRSHCILTIHIESRLRSFSDAKYVTSKLNLVDLAGSERLRKTGSEGQMMKEAMYINKSLSFLEQAILALADHRRDHIPFRQTKLTHALKDSLGGNCRTVLVANIYCEAAQIDETLSTLRFASRMKCVQTNPTVNEHVDPAVQITTLQREVQMLRDELSVYNTLVKQPNVTYEPLSEAQRAEIQNQVQSYLDGSLEEISIISKRQVQAVFAEFRLVVQEKEQKVKAERGQTDDLMKPDQSAPAAAVKKWDTRGSSEDTEADNFTASQTQRPTSTKTKKSRDKQSLSRRRGEGTLVSMRPVESASKSKPSSIKSSERELDPPEPDTDTQGSHRSANEPFQSESPLPKAEAFEDFKVGPGRDINDILKENKAVLLERRSLLRQLTEEVNAVKSEIDRITATLQQHKDQYLVLDGDSLLVHLGELKAQYRQRYEALRDIKAEVNYCQHLVDQCRVRLLSEFETWYKQCFLLPEQLHRPTKKDDTEERRRQSVFPPESPGSESFYNARDRTLIRRKSRAQSAASRQKRLPLIRPVTAVT